jgi:hypothetical protein
MDPDPAPFVNDLQDAKPNFFSFLFFNLLLFEGTFTSFFKDKKLCKSHKKIESFRFIFVFFLDNGRIRIPGTLVVLLIYGVWCGSNVKWHLFIGAGWRQRGEEVGRERGDAA